MDKEKVSRMANLMKLLVETTGGPSKTKLIDFEAEVKEVSGFSFDEKHRLFELLTNFGIPVCAYDEGKEDWELLKTLLVKMTLG